MLPGCSGSARRRLSGMHCQVSQSGIDQECAVVTIRKYCGSRPGIHRLTWADAPSDHTISEYLRRNDFTTVMTLQLIREAYPIAEVGRERPRLVTVGIDERVHIDTREVDRYHNSTRLMGMVGRPS